MLGQQGGSGVVARAKVRTVKVFYLNSNKVFNKVSNLILNLKLNLNLKVINLKCTLSMYLI